jgi:hypothetical protein
VAPAKTNAVRMLDSLGIRDELRPYDVDPDDLAAETVAQKIGMSPEQVFKTLVARGDKHGVCLAVVPGNCELDLKALAKTTGDKQIETVLLKEVELLTGTRKSGRPVQKDTASWRSLMNLVTEPYLLQAARWPSSGRRILAQFDDESVIAYQAYRPAIGHFVANSGYFAGDFNLNRMTGPLYEALAIA